MNLKIIPDYLLDEIIEFICHCKESAIYNDSEKLVEVRQKLIDKLVQLDKSQRVILYEQHNPRID